MTEPIAWMVVNNDGREAFVTADPMLANVNRGQRALPLYTAPVMDTCAEVRLHGVTIPDRVRIVFVMPMPASWSAKKRAAMDGKPHTCRPDNDNQIKGLLDAVFSDDAHVWDIRSTKIWGQRGEIWIGELEGAIEK